MSGAAELLSVELVELVNEYDYRQIFPATTHEEYCEMPYSRVRWMLHIDRVKRQVEEERQDRRRRGGPR